MNIKYRQYICNSIRTFRACFAIGIQNDTVWGRAKCFFSGGDICSVLLRDQVYLFGGTGIQSVDRQNSRMVECYDIKSNTWLDAHSMPYNDTYFKGCPVSMFNPIPAAPHSLWTKLQLFLKVVRYVESVWQLPLRVLMRTSISHNF